MQTTTVDQGQEERQEERVERATLAVDLVVLATTTGGIPDRVLLIQRRWDPYQGCWALPGGLVEPGEDLVDAAARELAEETSLELDTVELTQIGAYGDPGRDPRGRVVSVAFVATVTGTPGVAGEDDAVEARWHCLSDVLTGCGRLAFDHRQIISDAIQRF